MKVLRFISLVVLAFLLASCSGSIGRHDGGAENELSFAADDVKTIMSCSYLTASSYSSSAGGAVDGPSYLSCNTADDPCFRLMVFITSKGNRVIFQDPQIQELGDGYCFVRVSDVVGIRREPRVVYEDTGRKDEHGNPIMEQKTAYVEVSTGYGSNFAIIDQNADRAFLINSLEYSDDWLYVDRAWASDRSLYFFGYRMDSSTAGWTLYSIGKGQLAGGHLSAVTNPAGLDLYDVYGISDEAVLLSGSEGLYIIDRQGGLSPQHIIPKDYAMDYGDAGTIVPFDNPGIAILDHSIIYDFKCVQDYGTGTPGYNVACLSYVVENGSLRDNGCTLYPIPFQISDWSRMEKIAQYERGGRLEAYYVIAYDVNEAIMRVRVGNGLPDVEIVQLSSEDRSAGHFEANGSRMYWIGGHDDNINGSSIRYYDFDSGSFGRFQIMGKPAAGSDFSISDNGTIIFTQYMSDVDVGIYSWNPDLEDHPTLLSLKPGDVHAIVDISTL